MKQNNDFRDESIITFGNLVHEMFNKSLDTFSKEIGVTTSDISYPKVDVVDYSDRVELTAEIPGLNKEDIDIKVDNDLLTLSGTKSKDNVNVKDGKIIFKEIKSSSFKRTFRFSTKIYDVTKISAKFLNGVLNLTIPKLNSVPSPIKVNIQ